MLKDSFGRTFPYIRMSITDVCNFKCGYCLPNGYQVDKSDNRKFLHLDEIKRLAKCFSELGVNKIRITGGEPTVRKDFFEIIKVLKEDAQIKKVVITTNGYHLDEKAKMLVDSGLNGINISIDSKFGIIAPYSKDFCKTCNRLRITSRGDLRLCLFGNTGISVRHLLQKDDQLNELKDLILKQMQFKKESHYLELGDTGSTKNLSKTGG